MEGGSQHAVAVGGEPPLDAPPNHPMGSRGIRIGSSGRTDPPVTAPEPRPIPPPDELERVPVPTRPAYHASVSVFSSAEDQEAIRVATTNIFARICDGRQLLVYSLHLDSPREVAMILPVPMAVGAGEDSFRFVDLSRRRRFFEVLEHCFPQPVPLGAKPASATLTMHRVGSYEAWFVPSLADFHRLDASFRLPGAVWQQLPMYRDWSFAVIRLAPGAQDVHPVGFEFPSRVPDAVYFPTFHIHDGVVHSTAKFLHKLYLQGLTRTRYLTEVLGHPQPDWRWKTTALPHAEDASRPLRTWVTDGLAAALSGIVDVDAPLLRLHVYGDQPNADIWLAESRDGVFLTCEGVFCSRGEVGRLQLAHDGLSFGLDAARRVTIDAFTRMLEDDDEHGAARTNGSMPAQPIDAVGFTVAIEQVSHFETTIAENEPGCMTLTFTLADGESLQFRLRDRPVTSLRRWCARVGLPCSV